MSDVVFDELIKHITLNKIVQNTNMVGEILIDA